jgi:hypothetical protein
MPENQEFKIAGRNLPSSKMPEIISEEYQILVFLRHLGCSLTKQLIADIKALEKKHGTSLPITFVSHGSEQYCDHFWQMWSPKSRVIFDTDMSIAKKFGLKEGSIIQVMDIKTMYCSIRAVAHGHFLDVDKSSNVFMLPGVFIYRDGKEIYKHIAKSAGDMPDFENLVITYIKESSVN